MVDNVLEFRGKNLIFNGMLRQRIANEIQGRGLTQNPEPVIAAVEEAICVHVVSAIKSFGETLALIIWSKILNKLESKAQ